MIELIIFVILLCVLCFFIGIRVGEHYTIKNIELQEKINKKIDKLHE